MADTTPLMQQYTSIKSQYEDYVLLFRLGDFYEFFYQDAIEISELLNLALTQRSKVPMCGVPANSLEGYLQKLVNLGKKIAICEQVSSPQKGQLVDREVVDIITPGTVHSITQLADDKPNYLLSCWTNDSKVYCAWIDVSQGILYSQTMVKEKKQFELVSLVEKLDCKELLLPEKEYTTQEGLYKSVSVVAPQVHCSKIPDWKYSESIAREHLNRYFGSYSYESLGFTDTAALLPVAALFEYLVSQKQSPNSLQGLQFFSDNSHMRLNSRVIRDLELFDSKNTQSSTYTLFGVCNECESAGGKRLLHHWLRFPLQDIAQIQARHQLVEYCLESDRHISLRTLLTGFADLERIYTLMLRRNPAPRYIHTIRLGLQKILKLAEFVRQHKTLIDRYSIFNDTSQLETLFTLIDESLEDPPAHDVGEGTVIRDKSDQKLAQLRALSISGSSLIHKLADDERAQSKANFRLKFSKLIGYYFEAAHRQRDSVPSHFILRQTLTNYDRYKSQALQELENKLFSAQEDLVLLEKSLFQDLCVSVNEHRNSVLEFCRAVAELDVYQSFARIANAYNYVKPNMVTEQIIQLKESRHPIIEQHLPHGAFVSNSVQLSPNDSSLLIITGPNMSGKSTILRQVALAVIMAHMGCFVPCKEATIGIVDQVSTRIGASDNLSKGESTFLTEMVEASSIIRSASGRSLVIMDEVGRGTSVDDGMSIAQALVEYLATKKVFTLFATHYHLLAEIFAITKNIKNYSFTVETTSRGIVFTRKFHQGASSNSYGIEVAALAGMPTDIIERANAVLSHTKSKEDLQLVLPLEDNDAAAYQKPSETHPPSKLAEYEEIIQSIKNLDLNSLTPFDSAKLLFELQKRIQDR